MNPNAYAVVGLTAIVAALVAVLTFAVLRIASAARDTRSSLRGSGGDTVLLTAALQDAVAKLKAQERAMSARAVASERLSGEIIASLTAGLLVVELGGDVRIINPAGRRLLGLGEEAPFDDYRQLPPPASRLATVIDECLRNRTPIVRRKLELSGSPVSHLGLTLSPPVDLKTIAERVADEWRPDARTRGGNVVVSGQFGTVDGDDVLLRQAFSNLLRNAIDACAAAGVPPQVSVDAEVDRAQHVCRINVNDNGPGIEPAARDRVFRPFFTTKAAGTGLGLALVLKIIVTHNGRITIGTAPLGGASLQVTLPLSDD